MRQATLKRTTSSPSGTFGEITTDKGLKLKTGELQSKHNEPHVSCIPPGKYTVIWAASPHFGECYHVQNVPARSNILIHAANWMGQKALGMKCDLEGCIAIGREVGQIEGQVGLKNSRMALKEFEGHMNHEPFDLVIVDATNRVS